MSVGTVKTRLATLQALVAGVGRAYVSAPNSLPPGDLPAFVNFTAGAQYDLIVGGATTNTETRQYLMRLYVAPVAAGLPGEVEGRCDALFTAVRDYFTARPSLGGLTGVQNAVLTGDGGVQVFPYAGVDYIGIEFKLNVTEYINIVYAQNE